jgi:hypothetical protein
VCPRIGGSRNRASSRRVTSEISNAYPFDHAGALMTQHDCWRHAIRLVALGDIGVANSSRGDPYQGLVVPQLIKIESFERGGLMWRGLHQPECAWPAERR